MLMQAVLIQSVVLVYLQQLLSKSSKTGSNIARLSILKTALS
jgi:hypothetical protein